jgi:hypothetical protein
MPFPWDKKLTKRKDENIRKWSYLKIHKRFFPLFVPSERHLSLHHAVSQTLRQVAVNSQQIGVTLHLICALRQAINHEAKDYNEKQRHTREILAIRMTSTKWNASKITILH